MQPDPKLPSAHTSMYTQQYTPLTITLLHRTKDGYLQQALLAKGFKGIPAIFPAWFKNILNFIYEVPLPYHFLVSFLVGYDNHNCV